MDDNKNVEYIKQISKKLNSGKIIDRIFDSIHRYYLVISSY